jgi:uncharacterized protein YbjT (DUF2867 family)
VDPLENGIVVTGANGQLGRALLARLAQDSHPSVRALVRSDRARKTIESERLVPPPDIRVVDYTSPKQMEEALSGARCVIHLVGIIKEMPGTGYAEAHEQTCHALALAADRAGIERIVYLSILGSTPDSKNPCLASKGRAETMLLDDRVPTTVIRVPMVIGGNDAASHPSQSGPAGRKTLGQRAENPLDPDQRGTFRRHLSRTSSAKSSHHARDVRHSPA